MNIIPTLDQYMKNNGISRAQLAKKAGVGKSEVTRMFNNPDRDVSLKRLVKLCKALDLTILIIPNKNI